MNTVKLWVLFVSLFLIMCPHVHAFEVNGFVTGMSQEEVRKLLAESKFEWLGEKDNFIRAWDIPDSPTSRWLVFTFCNKKLMRVQEDIYPSMKNFILKFGALSTAHGKPTESHTDKKIDQMGETNTISFIWRAGTDVITLRYNVGPNNDQLSLIYENTSKCSK